MAEEREVIRQALQPAGGRYVKALPKIVGAYPVLFLRQYFLDVAQDLLHLRRELAVGEICKHVAALCFGAHRVRAVAVGLVHLLELDFADLLLGLGRFLHVGIEQDEILVLRLGLRVAVRAALVVPTIGDGQLGLGQVLALIVGVHERVQGQARHLEPAVLDILDRLVEQHFVGLLGALGDGVFILLGMVRAGRRQARHHNHRHAICKRFSM